MKHYGYVYKIVCKVNGKMYIGQTIRSVEERWRSHKYDAKKRNHKDKLHISRAINKYGEENFKISTVCFANNQQELNVREKTAIRLFDSIRSGFNLHEGGLNQRLSLITRAKISAANKGRKKPLGFGEKIRQSRLGKKNSESTKIKCSQSQIREKSAWFGKKHSEETRAKMRKAQKGRKHSPESIEKMRNKKLGKKMSEEAKKKMSVRRFGRKPNQRPVICLNDGRIFSSIKEAASTLKMGVGSIRRLITGEAKEIRGLRVKYI